MTVLNLRAEVPRWTTLKVWQTEVLFAVPIVALVIYLFYTWFAVLNRYLIFLYFYNQGPGYDTSPFGWVTVSRYWMSGLVAGGAVMVPYLTANFMLGRLKKDYRAPVWWRLWVLCAVPLGIFIPAIVMTVNDPVLPLRYAAQVTIVALLGLALAVRLGEIAASHPAEAILLSIDGFALACLLMALRALEWHPRYLVQGASGAVYRFRATLAVGIGLIIVMTLLYFLWRRAAIPPAGLWLAAGANIYYLFLPIYHYLFWCTDTGSWTDPDYFSYIPDADNYFTRSAPLQIGIWIAVVLVVISLTRLRLRLRHQRPGAQAE